MKTPTVVALHGFTGHADSWQAIRAALPDHRVEALTIFGHDATRRPTGVIAFDDEVTRIAAAIRALGDAPVRLCGYSMGGRIALGVLAKAPELVASAVLVGAHPGLTTDAEREERGVADEVWAQLLRDQGTEAFAEKWQAQPLFATQARLPTERLAAQQAIRLRHDAHALALALTSLGLGRMPSYWDVLPALAIPVDLVVGALDEKFAALALRMNAKLARGRIVRVPDAGHNVLLERPEDLAELIRNAS